MPRLLPAVLLGSVALLGCAERSLSELPPVPGNVVKLTIPVKLNRNIDLLFMVDNSGSMIEEQASLTTNFPAFINVLNTIEGGLPDVHIGVISSNVGTGGVNIGGCSTATRPQGDDGNLLTNNCAGLTAAYIEDIKRADGSRMQNYSATWRRCSGAWPASAPPVAASSSPSSRSTARSSPARTPASSATTPSSPS
jgi:hypothetical protein